MTKLSEDEAKNIKVGEYFTLWEYLHTSHDNQIDANLSEFFPYMRYIVLHASLILDPIRKKYGKPLYISSGFRNKTLNKIVGGADNSQHLLGQAADIIVGRIENLSESEAVHRSLFLDILRMHKDLPLGQVIFEFKRNSYWIHVALGKPYIDHTFRPMIYRNGKYSDFPWHS